MIERWIIEFSEEYPRSYIAPGGEVTYQWRKAQPFQSEAAAIAQMRLWRLGSAWKPIKRILPDIQILDRPK